MKSCFKQNKIFSLCVILSMAIGGALHGKTETEFEYTSIHNPIGSFRIPFFAPNNSYEYFAYFSRAIEIISITCDGEIVQPETWRAISGDAKDTITVKSRQLVYDIDYNCIESNVYIDGEVRDDTLMKRYIIPRDAEQIVIRYIVHFPDGTASSPCSVTSMSRNCLKITSEYSKIKDAKARSADQGMNRQDR